MVIVVTAGNMRFFFIHISHQAPTQRISTQAALSKRHLVYRLLLLDEEKHTDETQTTLSGKGQ